MKSGIVFWNSNPTSEIWPAYSKSRNDGTKLSERISWEGMTLTMVSKQMRVMFLSSQDYEDKETALLIDRYKYMDLLPCSQTELRSLGYKVKTGESLLLQERMLLNSVVSVTLVRWKTCRWMARNDSKICFAKFWQDLFVLFLQDTARQHMLQPQLSDMRISMADYDDDDRTRPKYPTPDTSQMIPFKPKVIVRKYPLPFVPDLTQQINGNFVVMLDHGSFPFSNARLFLWHGIAHVHWRSYWIYFVAPEAHPVAGGVFPMPPAAADLVSKLPPPTSFNVSVADEADSSHVSPEWVPSKCFPAPCFLYFQTPRQKGRFSFHIKLLTCQKLQM